MKRTTLIAICIGSATLFGVAVGYHAATGGFDESQPVPEWLLDPPIAHRGLHTGDSVRPENSLAAFRAAAEAGYAIELDVQLTADGTVVVMHDDNLERMTGDPRDISELKAATVTRLHLLGSAETVPTLREVLRVVHKRVPVYVEVKNRGAVGRLEDALVRELAASDARVAVMSFNPFSLARFAENARDIPRGQLSGTFEGEDLSFVIKFVLGRMLMNWKSRPQFIAYEISGLPSVGTLLQQRRGRPLLVWTATTTEEYWRARNLGDNVMFELGAVPGE